MPRRQHHAQHPPSAPHPPLRSLAAPRWVGLSLGVALLGSALFGAEWAMQGRDPSGMNVLVTTVLWVLPAFAGSLWGVVCMLIEWPVLPPWFRWLALTIPVLLGMTLLVLWRSLGLI